MTYVQFDRRTKWSRIKWTSCIMIDYGLFRMIYKPSKLIYSSVHIDRVFHFLRRSFFTITIIYVNPVLMDPFFSIECRLSCLWTPSFPNQTSFSLHTHTYTDITHTHPHTQRTFTHTKHIVYARIASKVLIFKWIYLKIRSSDSRADSET